AQSINASGGPTAALLELERVARPGDVVAVDPVSEGVELHWALGTRSDDGPSRAVQVAGLRRTTAIALTGRKPSGRIWLMQYNARSIGLPHYRRCARTWHNGPSRLVCIERSSVTHVTEGTEPSILTIYDPSAPIS